MTKNAKIVFIWEKSVRQQTKLLSLRELEVRYTVVLFISYPMPSLITISLQLDPANIVRVPKENVEIY